MKLVISVDVEEDGLFSGRYPATPPGVTNVAELDRLRFLPEQFGIPLTLLATYPVLNDAGCCGVLKRLVAGGAEAGVHLHPWCTPPFQSPAPTEPVPTAAMPVAILDAKLRTLCDACATGVGAKPRSFRAGRFDITPPLVGLLPRFGLEVDSSIVPLRWQPNGAMDHFPAPPDPYWDPATPAVLEAPLTVVPVWPAAARAVTAVAPGLSPRPRQWLYSAVRRVNAAGIHPLWHPLVAMKLAAALHARRGGRVLNMFLHSSELSPGATPRHRTSAEVDAFVGKIRRFVEWLTARYVIEGSTLAGLLPMFPAKAPRGRQETA